MATNKIRRYFDGNLFFLLGCLIFFSALLIDTYQYEIRSAYMLPRALGYLTVVLVIVIIIQDLVRKRRRFAEMEPVEAPPEDQTTRVKAFPTILFSTAYFLLIPVLGFPLATFLAIYLFTRLMKHQNKILCLVISIGTSLLMYVVFVHFLKIQLPKGVFGLLF